METNEIYLWVDTVMGELKFHKDVYEEVVGQYPKDQQEDILNFFIKGCKNFAQHPQDVLNEMERDLK